MDPITVTLVSALAAGATAVAQGFATEAIKDAYKALKQRILSRFDKAAPFVEAVESDPTSEPEQKVLAKQLPATEVDQDTKTAATALLDELTKLRNNEKAQAVFDFGKLEAAKNFELRDIVFSGTLLRAKEAKFEGDFLASGLRQAKPDEEPRKN